MYVDKYDSEKWNDKVSTEIRIKEFKRNNVKYLYLVDFEGLDPFSIVPDIKLEESDNFIDGEGFGLPEEFLQLFRKRQNNAYPFETIVEKYRSEGNDDVHKVGEKGIIIGSLNTTLYKQIPSFNMFGEKVKFLYLVLFNKDSSPTLIVDLKIRESNGK